MKREPARDVVKALGYLALGSRLRRIGEQLQLQAQPVLDGGGLQVSAAHYPLLAALERAGTLGAVELAAALGVSQPGVTRGLEKLKRAGLVKAARRTDDRRERPMMLSRSGRELIHRSRLRIWPQLEAAVIEACGPDSTLLEQLAALEQALATTPLTTRAARISARQGADAAP